MICLIPFDIWTKVNEKEHAKVKRFNLPQWSILKMKNLKECLLGNASQILWPVWPVKCLISIQNNHCLHFCYEKFAKITVQKPFEKINFSIRKNRFSFELIDLNFEDSFKELPASAKLNKWLKEKLSTFLNKCVFFWSFKDLWIKSYH